MVSVNPTLDHALLRDPRQVDLEETNGSVPDVSAPEGDFEVFEAAGLAVDDQDDVQYQQGDGLQDGGSSTLWTDLGLEEYS